MIMPIMEDDEREIPINFAVRTLCDQHKPRLAGKNEKASGFLLMSAFMNKLSEDHKPETQDEVDAMFGNIRKVTQAACCYIGEEAFAGIVKRTPATTGDEQRDEEIAIMIAEGNIERVRPYPSIGENVPISEGGTTYVMSLGSPTEDKGNVKAGELVAILSRVLDIGGPEGTLEVLTVSKQASEKTAKEWFREELNAKKWLRGEPS